MKIAESNVNMSATSSKATSTKASFVMGTITMSENPAGKLGVIDRTGGRVDKEAFVELSDAAKDAFKELKEARREARKEAQKQENANNTNRSVTSKISGAKISSYAKLPTVDKDYRFVLLEKLMSMIMGKKYKIYAPKEMSFQNQGNSSTLQVSGNQDLGNRQESVSNAFVQLKFTSSSLERYESEKVSFSAQASVKTEDGRSINIDIGLNLSRALYQKLDATSLDVSIGTFCDPLVINFGAASAQLSDHKITFDLDCDGTNDQISTLMSGSGYLALDKNGDGKINDGNELFGTQNGDGFADLAQYDKDSNGWIDENDEIWDKLRIWMPDENGESKLVGLGEMGIGAIYLGNVGTDFTLQNDDNVNGMIRKTGFFLFENGSAGTVQHVDLKI